MKRPNFPHTLTLAIPLLYSVLSLLLPQASGAEQVCYDGGILLDYGDPGYQEGGKWENVTGNYYTAGQSWTDSRKTDDPGAWVRWTPNLPAAGRYRVYLWHIPCSDEASSIEIVHRGKSDTLTRDMRWGHLGWTSLGDYDFAAGSDGSVKMTRGKGTLFADSVKLVPEASIHPLKPLPAYPRPDGSTPHLDAQGNVLLSGKPYQVLYQELLEETVNHPESIPTYDETFDTALAQGVNTLGVTLTWKTFETAEGVYDYRVIDALIQKARERNMHLDLVLFFAWRNLQSYYVPRYIFDNRATYLEVLRKDGTDGGSYKVSPFAENTLAAETRALQALLQRVKQDDPGHQVVILAQVENEMPCVRDYSEPGQKAWNGPVPAALMEYLAANQPTLSRWLTDTWNRHGRKTAGTWAEVFGDDDAGGRVFGAWTFGQYMQSLVISLKQVLDIPMYCNAWAGESPCYYTYMDVFHASAPAIDAMGPDAYGTQEVFEREAAASMRPWNHLVVPEQHHSVNTTWRAIGNYAALLSGSYYDVEGGDWLRSAETYALVTQMMPLLCEKKGTGEMLGFYQYPHDAGQSWTQPWQDLKVTLTPTVRLHTWYQFDKNHPAPCEQINNVTGGELDGCGLLVQMGKGDYIITSTRVDVTLALANGGPIRVTRAETGHFRDGAWVRDGRASWTPDGNGVRITFPTENRRYGQVRVRLAAGG